MWRSPPTAVDEIARQVRRVRRRRNLHAAQLGLYGVTTAFGTAASVVVLLALTVAANAFALGTLGVAVGALLAAGAALRVARRRWTPARRAARWIDGTAGLRERLATLLELRRRDGEFVPLLVAQNLERLDAWRPERLVPRRVPLLTLGAALLAVSCFVLTLTIVPELVPPLPELTWTDQPFAPVDVDAATAPARRLMIAPIAGGNATGGGASLPGVGVAPRRRGAQLALLDTLQDRIRRSLWGDRGTAATMGGATQGREAHTAPSAGATGTRAAAEAPPVRDGGASDSSQSGTADPATGSGAASGADPDLFAVPADDEPTDGRFALGLAARVHGPRGAPSPLSGDAPSADPDAHPPLATGPHEAALPWRAGVPAEYETIVRSLFAHPTEDTQ